jgi:hypothetical protein
VVYSLWLDSCSNPYDLTPKGRMMTRMNRTAAAKAAFLRRDID